ncbi:MAG: PAS domain-containing sensor histidine kinase [Candidatus Obscuribacterales bacterium]|nr:PAS domain-containing sensor histidine kinase [Candidatus Obscuribacterales bacterium]
MFPARLSIAQKVIILVGTVLFFEVGFILVLGALFQEAESRLQEEVRAREVVSHVNSLNSQINRLLTAIVAPVAVKDVVSELVKFEKSVRRDLDALKALTRGNERDEKEIDELCRNCYAGLDLIRSLKITAETEQVNWSGREFKLLQFNDDVAQQMNSIVEKYREIQKFKEESAREAREMVYYWLVAVVLANVVLAGLATTIFILGISRRLKIVKDNAVLLAANQELNPPIGGYDDISELDRLFHETAAALKESIHKERALVENARDVICTISAELKFASVSPASETVFGYEPEELTEVRISEVIPSESLEHMVSGLELSRQYDDGEPFESTFLKKDGDLIYILWSVQWSEHDQSYFCVAHDISDRREAELLIKQSEERIRSIFNNVPVSIVSASKYGAVDYVNKTFLERFDYERDAAQNLKLEQIFAAREGGDSPPQWSHLVFGPQSAAKVYQLLANTNNGAAFPAEVVVNRYESTEGERLLIAVEDIAERVELEERKQQFVSMVSHDLRTPLTSIRGFLTLLKEGCLDLEGETGVRRVGQAERTVERLIVLVNDLLDIEKIESGRMELDLIACDPVLLSREAIATLKSLAEEKNVEIELVLRDDFKALALADEERGIQVLINLLSNAVKFSPEGSSVILQLVDGLKEIEFRVIDRGRGVPEDKREIIFDRFRQVESSDGRRGKGTGLGLPICKTIVEAHGGSIGVGGSEVEGATFWFTIPKVD